MEQTWITPPGHKEFLAKKLFEFPEGAGGTVQWAALAYIKQGGGGPEGGHVHDSGHIFIVSEGQVRVMLGTEAHVVKKDESFMVPGGALHSIWNDEAETAKVMKINIAERAGR